MPINSKLIAANISITLLLFTGIESSAEDLLIDQYAPTQEEIALWEENAALLVALDKTSPNISPLSKDQQSVLHELDKACEQDLSHECQTHIKAHRVKLLSVLPDNPRYWQYFWSIVEASNFLHLDFGNPGLGTNTLIEASRYWFYRDLADDGEIDIERMLYLQQGIRNWRTGHQTILMRMIAVGMHMITSNQVSFAMAQASRQRDLQALNQLLNVAKPASLAEMSFGPVFWAEREYTLRNTHQWMDDEPISDVDVEYAMSLAENAAEQESIRLLVEDPKQFHAADLDLIAQHYVPYSTTPWATYWIQGIPRVPEGFFPRLSFAAISAPAYGNYVETDRFGHFRSFLIPPLFDIYTGAASPGVPARPAPAHWQWVWYDGEQPLLCLSTDKIHPSTHDFKKTPYEVCINYYDEKAVEALLIR